MIQIFRTLVAAFWGFAFCAFQASAEVGPARTGQGDNHVVLAQVENFRDHVDYLKAQLEALSSQVAALKDSDLELVRLSTETENLERERYNALMDISNALAVGDRNMDAATAAISASEAYLSSANFWAAICAIFVAGAAVWVTVKVTRISEDVAKDIAEELTKVALDVPSDSASTVVRFVRDAVKQDLEETPTALMQNATFKENLETLVYAAVEAKLSNANEGDEEVTLSDNGFTGK
jgi:ubiquinone biosynthesis protein UbiJ